MASSIIRSAENVANASAKERSLYHRRHRARSKMASNVLLGRHRITSMCSQINERNGVMRAAWQRGSSEKSSNRMARACTCPCGAV